MKTMNDNSAAYCQSQLLGRRHFLEALGLTPFFLSQQYFQFTASGEEPGPLPPKTTIGSEAQGITGILRPDGSLEELRLGYASGWQKVDFRQDEWRGPGFGESIALEPEVGNPLAFRGEKGGIHYKLAYAVSDRQLRLSATVTNTSKEPFAPERLPLILGIDTFMNSYPRWDSLYFPTFLRCEPTHLWGYMMTPLGRIVAIASPDPVGSFTIEYVPKKWSHYIYTLSLDLLQKPPVPYHHPVYAPIAPGQTKVWRVNLFPVETLDAVRPDLAATASTPMLDLYRCSLEPGQAAEMRIFSHSSLTATVTTPAGLKVRCPVAEQGSNVYAATFSGAIEYGAYHIQLQNKTGKITTGQFFVHPPWSWYLKRARLEALRLTPRADLNDGLDGYSCESFYGLLGFYLAAKHFPDPAIDIKGDRLLNFVLKRLFREKNGMRFSGNPERIQNGEFMISLLVDRYEATGDLRSLEMANEFAEYVLSRQTKDGYYGGYNMVDYDAVLYPTKAITELMVVEEPLAAGSPKWQQRYERQAQSVKRAIDYMVAKGLDVNTEGEDTFEDGAVSCTALQIALFALRQKDLGARGKYTATAQQVLAAHACLTRLLDTDSRSIGGTARWWEAWYDEKRDAQMMTSPHGWAGWTLYANYYVYLLTGEERYLRELMNAMGACTQLLDWPSGRLRQAFVVDPHVRNVKRIPDPDNLRWGRAVETLTSEDYIGTIGAWWGRTTQSTGYLDRAKWACGGDGIPYEIFKAMEEIVLTNAFVIERADGTIIGYNCTVAGDETSVNVTPSESVVQHVHVNLKMLRRVDVSFTGEKVSAKCPAGMRWLTARNHRNKSNAQNHHYGGIHRSPA